MVGLCYTVVFPQAASKNLRSQVSCFSMILSLTKVIGYVTFWGADSKNMKQASMPLLIFLMSHQKHVFEVLKQRGHSEMYTCFENPAQVILLLPLCQRMLTIFKGYLQVRGSSHQFRTVLRKVKTGLKLFRSTKSFKSAHTALASIKRVNFDKKIKCIEPT